MAQNSTEAMTIPKFRAAKAAQRRLVVLTAYDFPTAKLFDSCGVDALLVGDSLGTTLQGRKTTLGVTMDQMVYHAELVSRAALRALVIADLPFLSYQISVQDALRNAGRLVQEGGAHAVKVEGGERTASVIRALVEAQIPVMGHVGLTPQSYHHLGGYRVQRDAAALLGDARAIEQAGAFSIVLEGIPREIARQITAAVSIPTIGIGAGPHCDGQVLVWYDALGFSGDFHPRFVKNFAAVEAEMKRGVHRFADEVRSGEYPDESHSYS